MNKYTDLIMESKKVCEMTGGLELTEILFFKRLVAHKYTGMVLLYLHRMGPCHKKRIDQDLKVAEESVTESIEILMADRLIRSVKCDDKRKDMFELTPAGTRAAQALSDMVKVLLQELPHQEGLGNK
jgi:Mn-dependent DtxR family transcriptional regulator